MTAKSENKDLLRDDTPLRDAFRSGKRWAMTRVFQEYEPLVRTVCRHGFGKFRGFYNPVDREDAIQTIFLSAFEERARLSYDGIKPYGAFLRGIAHNTVRRILERDKRFDRRPDEFGPDEISAEQELIRNEMRQLVQEFRKDLKDPHEKEVLLRYYAEGWAEEKVAKHLGITRYKTRKIIAQLHRRMMKYMKAHGFRTP
jgi:RNA polymerase sigma factor (sigma-70 family)